MQQSSVQLSEQLYHFKSIQNNLYLEVQREIGVQGNLKFDVFFI